MKQLHKKFSTEQVIELLEKYEGEKVERKALEEILDVSKAHFFRLLQQYRADKENFSIGYKRNIATNEIEDEVDEFIVEELKIQKRLIDNTEIPIRRYNYSYAVGEILRKYKVKVSLQTIINRAKLWGYYKNKGKVHKAHDRVVYTNSTGDLIQHDSSYHLFAPLSGERWYLITSIDDYSRLLLYARLIEAESSIEHIKSLEKVFLHHGFPVRYYVDRHSIFEYIPGRDDNLFHKSYYVKASEIDTQWQQVLNDCNVRSEPALSPQAKGKVERPYQWIQDHMVRRCDSQKIVKIEDAQEILDEEIETYNYKIVHSTTKEVPYYRFKRALKEGNSLWRKFEVPKPFLSKKDIFCLRFKRTADGYRTISLKTKKLQVNGLNPYDDVDVRVYKLNNQMSELRFWRNQRLLDTQIIQNDSLKGINF